MKMDFQHALKIVAPKLVMVVNQIEDIIASDKVPSEKELLNC